MVAVGALLFASGNGSLACVGRFLQGTGGVSALVGAVYIATRPAPNVLPPHVVGLMAGIASGAACSRTR
jgi:hypothetical protein